MKIKVTKLKKDHDLKRRLRGIAYWRVTGPDPSTGERVSVTINGTRSQALSILKTGDG